MSFLNEVDLPLTPGVIMDGFLEVMKKPLFRSNLVKEMMEISTEAKSRFNQFQETALFTEGGRGTSRRMARGGKKGLTKLFSSQGGSAMTMGVDKHVTHAFGWWVLKQETQHKVKRAKEIEKQLLTKNLDSKKANKLYNELTQIKELFEVESLENFKPGTEEYNNYLDNRFTTMILRTQNTFDHRTAAPIQKIQALRPVTYFMSQPLKNGMMSFKQVYLARESSKNRDMAKCARHLLNYTNATIGQALLLQAIRNTWAVGSGRLEPEEFLELENWYKGMASSMLATSLGFKGILLAMAHDTFSPATKMGGGLGQIATGTHSLLHKIFNGDIDMTDPEDLVESFILQGPTREIFPIQGPETIINTTITAPKLFTEFVDSF